MYENYDPFEIKLAHEIADTLNDEDSITMHLQYVRKYNEPFLRKQLKKVLSIPPHKIRSSRAAYYVFLVNTNATGSDYRD